MKQRKGFTLIELMIVIAIIIILAAIAIPNYLRMTNRAKVSAIESDLKSLATALEAYNTDWAGYPTGDWANMKLELTGAGTVNNAGGTGTTVTGEKSPITYITANAITAVETKLGATGTKAYTLATGAYTVTLTSPIGGKTYTFIMTSGGEITVSSA